MKHANSLIVAGVISLISHTAEFDKIERNSI
jgi:hypothetical protein